MTSEEDEAHKEIKLLMAKAVVCLREYDEGANADYHLRLRLALCAEPADLVEATPRDEPGARWRFKPIFQLLLEHIIEVCNSRMVQTERAESLRIAFECCDIPMPEE